MLLRKVLAALFLTLVLKFTRPVHSNDEMEAGERRHFELSPEDAVPMNKWAGVDDARNSFPGDLIVGYRLADEVLYRRVIEIRNPTNELKTGIITFSVPRGQFHYVSAINRAGSVGVMCEEPYTIGNSETGFRVRSQPNTQVVLDCTFAAH
ncbi:uncharacterized protein LOC124175595 [Neodiprion fabricii]|uniref:uncharacterized protein LOC124175595 n=1 Tax=Neodiprion fabricii TaxID=2872261 RepID=UPI001ED94409|nr:uncharacterized protein LOC124175595 [Neodiprion fabricii]